MATVVTAQALSAAQLVPGKEIFWLETTGSVRPTPCRGTIAGVETDQNGVPTLIRLDMSTTQHMICNTDRWWESKAHWQPIPFNQVVAKDGAFYGQFSDLPRPRI